MGVQVNLVLLATTCTAHGWSPSLRPNSGAGPLVVHWVKALQRCPRLLPPKDKVYVVASPESAHCWLDEQVLGALGLDAANILVSATPNATPAASLAHALSSVPSLASGYVVLASLDHFFGHAIPLQQLVEHTVVRGKTTCAYFLPPPGHSTSDFTMLALDEHANCGTPGSNPRITGLLRGDAAGVTDTVTNGVSDVALAALVIVRPSDLSAAAASSEPAWAGLMSAVLDVGRPVYGLHVDMCLSVATDEGLDFVVELTAFEQAERERERNKGPAAEALDLVVKCTRESGFSGAGDPDALALLQSAGPAKQTLLRYDALTSVRAERDGVAAVASPKRVGGSGNGRKLPERFADASTWRPGLTKKQHPVYETSANQIGRRVPSQCDLPDVYAGNSQAFTKAFAGPPTGRSSLITSVTRSKVHKLFDDY